MVDDVSLQTTLNHLIVEDCKGKGLKDFLIMPIQRIPRYNMILADLVSKTGADHCDHENLVEAGKKIELVCEHVEEMSAHASKMEKKMELAARIIFPKDEPIVLALPHRKYFWEDHAIISTSFVVNNNRNSQLQKKVNKTQFFFFFENYKNTNFEF